MDERDAVVLDDAAFLHQAGCAVIGGLHDDLGDAVGRRIGVEGLDAVRAGAVEGVAVGERLDSTHGSAARGGGVVGRGGGGAGGGRCFGGLAFAAL